MATPKKAAPTAAQRGASTSSHEDVDTLTSSAVADPHAVAFAERQKAPTLYDDPTVATPGKIEDLDEDAGQPSALIDPDLPSGLDPSVDNRDQVQPMLDTLAADAQEHAAAQGLAVAAINAHESDAVDVEAEMAEQERKREEAREATAASREEARSAAAAASDKK